MKISVNIMKILEEKINNTYTLIFDLDDTLINTNYSNFLAYKDAVTQVMAFNLDLIYSPKDRLTRKTLKQIIPEISELEYAEIIILKNKIYSGYLDKTEINKLTIEILLKYSKTNKIILVTNSHKERALMILKYHSLFDKFDHRFYKEDSDNGKEISKFKYVLTHLNIPTTSVVIFENEKIEVDAAILSGIPTENIIRI